MGKIDFDKKDKYHIGEYIFGWETDVLIKSDGDHLLDVFEKHNLIDNKKLSELKIDVKNGKGLSTMKFLEENVSLEQRREIMSEYSTGILNY